MIPPQSKSLERLTSMIWRFLSNNKNLHVLNPSNRYYSPWPKNVLIQPSLARGLHVQDYESQLCANLAKWIFKLIDPRHLASWKSLPFYFFDDLFPGLGSSIFLANPIITKSFGTDPDRWLSYLNAWLHSGFSVSPPPKDFHCILNESLWFNRFIFDPDRNTRGRSFTKSIEVRLIKLGFTHVRDLLSTQLTDDKL
jgi:hypothetical protein